MGVRSAARRFIKDCVQKTVFPLAYRIYCRRYPRIDEKLVVFADGHHTGFPEDMRLMRMEMERRGYRTVEAVADFSRKLSVSAAVSFLEYFAQAHYVFLCNYYLPAVSVKKREETKVIQLWHGCGALKKFGYDAADDLKNAKNRQLFQNFDLVTVSSEKCRAAYASAFRLPIGRVQALGVSRTDVYFSERYRRECAGQFYARYPQAAGKKILLWAPTFRHNAQEAAVVGEGDIDWLAGELGADWHVIKKLHPHSGRAAKGDVCDIPTERLYPVADLFLTDYSSAVMDYALLKKPFLLYAPDMEQFGRERGWYTALGELPAKVATDREQLLQMVLREEYRIDPAEYDAFLERELKMCDGNATERIAGYVEALG